MGFKLAVNLFADRRAQELTDTLQSFYREHGQRSLEIYRQMYGRHDAGEKLRIHDYPPRWVLVDIFLQPEHWIRERHLFVSRMLRCAGFFIFEYDGDYWGYEFFDNGEVLDRFTSNASYRDYFEGRDCRGDPGVLAEKLPFLNIGDIGPYLVRLPDCETVTGEEYDRLRGETDVFPRPGDQYRRWDECAVLNFIRALGIAGDFTGKWGSFEFSMPQYAEIDSGDFGREQTLPKRRFLP